MQSGYFISQTPQLDAKETVDYIKNEITPIINWATEWGIAAGFGMLGIVLFYQVVIILVKPDK